MTLSKAFLMTVSSDFENLLKLTHLSQNRSITFLHESQ